LRRIGAALARGLRKLVRCQRGEHARDAAGTVEKVRQCVSNGLLVTVKAARQRKRQRQVR
jgi:hypothetical protein